MMWFWFAVDRDNWVEVDVQAVKRIKPNTKSISSFRRKAPTFQRNFCFPQSKPHSYAKSPISVLKK